MEKRNKEGHGGTGKWREPGVPHKGWTCTHIDWLDDDSHGMTCEMCEAATIKLIHTMEHPNYPDELLVGCICAGNMEQDLVGAKRREAGHKKKVRARQRLYNQNWRVSSKGNYYTKTRGWTAIVFKDKSGCQWGGLVTDDNEKYFLQTKYYDSETAKTKTLELLGAHL